MSDPRRAFISYSTADHKYVVELQSFLRAAGFDEVFNAASSINPDEEFWPKIEQEIGDCDALIVVITPASNSADWVKREVEYARQLSKKIIPLRIEDCPLPSMFDGRDVIDFRPQARRAHPIDISRIGKYAPAKLIGREAETKLLDDAWAKTLRAEANRPHVVTFVALGGEGKTALVTDWAATMAGNDWPGCDTAFAWSFYSQGTREQAAVSSDTFLAAALTFFGDEALANSAAGAFDKGRKLSQLVGERRALLILDGIEPLQYAPTSPTPGELKDQGLAALLKGLAANSRGLCIVTTRYAVPDLRAWLQTTAPMHELLRLATAAGVQLLRTLGVKTGAPAEFEKLVEDVDGHALTLQILGGFLARAHHGDIRRRDRVDIQKADARIQGGHAFRAMAAYVKWMEHNSDESRRQLALLSLLGLFDRPATADCVEALRRAPAIPGFTDPLVGLGEDDWEWILSALSEGKLLTVNRAEGSSELLSLDAHPLLREYFAQRVRDGQPEAWRAAHRRLYEHLCASTHEGDDLTLEELQPLYQAVAHGCQAGLQQEACDKVYFARIQRGEEFYSTNKLGAFGSDLGAVACFFQPPWSRVSPTLTEADQAWLLALAAFRLRALGRLTEALEPMRAGLRIAVKREDWKNTAIHASNLSQLELTLGEVAQAVADAEQSVSYANRSGDAFQRLVRATIHADALHQAGRGAEAEMLFRETEQMQAERQPAYTLLYSVQGFLYCDLLLAAAERAAWRAVINASAITGDGALIDSHHNVSQRAVLALKIAERNNWLLDIALDYLTLGRAVFYAAVLSASPVDDCRSSIDAAVSGLRRAGVQDYLPRGLLTRAWLRALGGARIGPDSAQADLDEAWEIAERGPMPLFLADIHLHRARLFFREAKYPWQSPQHDLDEARRLINKHGYHRRDEELADAEAALVHPAQKPFSPSGGK